MSGFDPETYKRTTRTQWQDAAEAWYRWGPTIEEWLAPATQRMLDAAGITAGSRVLDVAAGAGGQSLAAARRTGPTGHVLATDIAPAILEFAAKAATDAGFSNVTTRELDGEHLSVEEASFDAAISRVGLIYFPDVQGALAGIRAALRPGGRISSMVYSTADRNGSSRYRLGSSGVGRVATARSWTAWTFQPRRPSRGGESPRPGGIPGHHGRSRAIAVASGQRC